MWLTGMNALDLFVKRLIVLVGGACRAGLHERVCTIENTYKDAGQGEHSLLRSMELITTILAALEEHEHVYL